MSKIEQQVMASVAAIYLARAFFGATALKFYVLLASVWGIGRLVWVSKVFQNFAQVERSGVSAAGNFALHALEHTSTSVQLVLAVAAIAALWLLLDVARAAAPRGARLAA